MGRLPRTSHGPVSGVLGGAFRYFGPRRRHIANQNLRLCFPELDDAHRQQWIRRHFVSLARGVCETAACWQRTPDQLQRWVTHIEGAEYLQQALDRGRGAILLAAHFTHLEIGATLLSRFFPGSAVYRPANHPVVARYMRRGRQQFGPIIPKNDIRAMIKALKANRFLWMAPDQYDAQGVKVQFFGQTTYATAGVVRLAQLTEAPILPFTQFREPDGFRLHLMPPLSCVDDRERATQQLTDALEQLIRQQPIDYLWIHRRFKAIDGGTDPYAV